MSSGIESVPVVESNHLGLLTEHDLTILSSSEFFLIELNSNELRSFFGRANFLLVDTNKEFEPKNIFLGSPHGGKVEFFIFESEIEGEWKIRIKPLKGGVSKTISLDEFKIFGVVIDLENQIKNKNSSYFIKQDLIPCFNQNTMYAADNCHI